MQQRCVFQEWMFELPMQQQSVLVLACRGPDGVRKFHPAKQIVTYYRAAVLKAARVGRKLSVGEARGGSFMTLSGFDDYNIWGKLKEDYFSTIDELPLHYCRKIGSSVQGCGSPCAFFKRMLSRSRTQ